MAVASAVVVLATGACTGPGTPPPTGSPGPPTPDHTVAVRVVDGRGEFYRTDSGETFTPRGMNYNRFLPAGGRAGLADDVFATRYYDPRTVEADLAEMQTMGFNAVRVMIDTCAPADGCIGSGPSDPTINLAYVDNIVDFLRRARDHGLVVMIASNTLPDDSYWLNATGRLANDRFDSANNEFLNPQAVPIYVDYWTKVVEALIARGAPTEAIWAYELRQEHHFQAAYPPFTLTSGTVTAANGERYDMSSAADKDRMVDEGLAHWTDVLRTAIRRLDPTALVTVGFFVPNAPHPVRGPDDTRLVRTAYFLRESTADFADLHHYPGEVDAASVWENFGVDGAERMPVVLGEFGAITSWWSSPAQGAAAVMDLEVDACRAGFDGFLLWAWRGDDSDDLWWATTGDRELATVVSPVRRPDPCEYGDFDFVRFNLALSADVRASGELPESPATNVNDGTAAHWNAADRSPQWIELTLSSPADVDAVVLRVAQDPPGRSVHELWVRRAGGSLERMQVFDGVTAEGDVLTYQPDEPMRDVEAVRVVTVRLGDLAPAWHEIELLTSTPPR